MVPVNTDTILLLALYGALAFVYLLAAPGLVMAWLHYRWHGMGKYERLLVFGMVFLFFPGMILLSPFVNLRPVERRLTTP